MFDVHGGQDYSPPDLDSFAGDQIVIQHNTFNASCHRAVVIRGYPRRKAIINQNLTSYNDSSWAYEQKIQGSCHNQPFNFDSSDNCHDTSLDENCIPDILDLKEGFCSNGQWSESIKDKGNEYVGDFDGDGKDDLGRYMNTESPDVGFQVLLSSGSSFDPPDKWTSALEGKGGWYVGDFNGDGKDDLGRYIEHGNADDGFQVLLSNGNSFITPDKWSDAELENQDWYIGDFNGDGKDDIFRYVDKKSSADMFLSNGSGFNASGSWCNVENDIDNECFELNPDGKWHVGDFDGDGFSDISSYAEDKGTEVFLSCNEKVIVSNFPEPKIPDHNVIAYPNPFIDQIHFKIVSDIGDKISIEIFDINGKQVDKIFEGISQSTSMVVSNQLKKECRTGIYFAKIIFDDKVLTLKLIHLSD